jgi:hypothetical protein
MHADLDVPGSAASPGEPNQSVSDVQLSVDVPSRCRAEFHGKSINIFDGVLLVAISQIPEDTFEHLRHSFTQTFACHMTPRGDIFVPEQPVVFGANDGFKYSILDRNTRRPLENKYLLRVGSLFVVAQISGSGNAFDEATYEAIFETIAAR